LPVCVRPAQSDDCRGDMTFFGNQTLGARIERCDDVDDAGKLLHTIKRRADDGLKGKVGRDEALRFEDDQILLGEWLGETRSEDLLRPVGFGAENIERRPRDRRLKARHEDRARDHHDDPDSNYEPVVTCHSRAEPGKRRAFGERGPRMTGVQGPGGTGDFDARMKRTPREWGQGTIRHSLFSGLAAHLAPPAAAPPGSVARRTRFLGALRSSTSSSSGWSLAIGRAHLVSCPRAWARHRDGLERPSPFEAPGVLAIESFKNQRIRGAAPKSQREGDR
jgi:hypothetical protein